MSPTTIHHRYPIPPQPQPQPPPTSARPHVSKPSTGDLSFYHLKHTLGGAKWGDYQVLGGTGDADGRLTPIVEDYGRPQHRSPGDCVPIAPEHADPRRSRSSFGVSRSMFNYDEDEKQEWQHKGAMSLSSSWTALVVDPRSIFEVENDPDFLRGILPPSARNANRLAKREWAAYHRSR